MLPANAVVLPLSQRFDAASAGVPHIPAHSNVKHSPYVFFSAPAEYGRVNVLHVAMFAPVAAVPALNGEKQPILDADGKAITRKVFTGVATLQDPSFNLDAHEYTRVPVDRIGFAIDGLRHNMFNPLLVIQDEQAARDLAMAAHEFRSEYFRRNAVKGNDFAAELPAYAVTPETSTADMLARTMTVQADYAAHNRITGQHKKLEAERAPTTRGW